MDSTSVEEFTIISGGVTREAPYRSFLKYE